MVFKNVSCPGQASLPVDRLINALVVSCQAKECSEGLCNGYLFANDKAFSAILDRLHERNVGPQSNAIRVAVLIGESHFLSMLPELGRHCDLVILNDTSSLVNEFAGFLLKIFEASDNRKMFEAKFQEDDNPLFKKYTKTADGSDCSHYMLAPKSTGDKFFLASEERFQACKTAATRLRFCTTNIDICCFLAQLKKI